MSSSHSDETSGPLSQTPLNTLHHELSARMVPFAGYEMPVHYEEGILFEHNFTRTASGLFDVSHMGQYYLSGPDHETVAAAIERIVPGEVKALGRGRMRYTVLLNESGGIIDDLMITRPKDESEAGKLEIVVNAARKDVDIAYLRDRLPKSIDVVSSSRTGLLALQGPKAASVLQEWCPGVEIQNFMSMTTATFEGRACQISRAGYTGEDGFEISAEADAAEAIARVLIDHEDVMPVGLGARDSLRLEAGLCLYGHDIDEDTSPVEADLAWIIGKRRRQEKDFLGADRILEEFENGPRRKRVGIVLEGRSIAREGAEILASGGEREIGKVTSGGFSPSTEQSIAMGYVESAHANVGDKLQVKVRNRTIDASIIELPFFPHRFYRAPK
ncbi:MAG: glycine cleavage system aminomethyltransferase GcvT [Methyloligellaceae bacterium]